MLCAFLYLQNLLVVKKKKKNLSTDLIYIANIVNAYEQSN